MRTDIKILIAALVLMFVETGVLFVSILANENTGGDDVAIPPLVYVLAGAAAILTSIGVTIN